MADISLTISGSAWLLALGIALAIAASAFVYRQTVPEVSRGWRILLASLRAGVALLILLMLFQPILSVTRSQEGKPVVAVLVDNSASMALSDRKGDRGQELRRILQHDLFRQKHDRFDFVFFPFASKLGDRLPAAPDSLALNGDGTDLTRALEELKEALGQEYFAAVVLLTDGADNLGENPARYAAAYGRPVFPVAIGDPRAQKDVLITNYVTNEVAYSGTAIPVDVYIKSSGYGGRRVAVRLSHEGKMLDSKMVSLNDNGFEQKVRLHVTPEGEGFQKYEISMPHLDGELTYANNAKPFYVKVLKSKQKILLVAGAPGPDFVFLKRALESDPNLLLQTWVEKKDGQFYARGNSSAQQVREFDAFVFLDYPRRSSRRSVLEQLRAALARGKAVMFLPAAQTDIEKLWLWKDFLPFAAKPVRTGEHVVYVQPLLQGLHHPVMRLAEDDAENQRRWEELPPVFSNLTRVRLKPQAKALAAIDPQRTPGLAGRRGSSPVLLAAYRSGTRKSLTALAYGLWRWDLLMTGVGKSGEGYRSFVRNSVRWLTTLEDSKLVRIHSNKEIYRSGEEIQFSAQVYFEDYEPVDDAEVVVMLKGGKGSQQLTLTSIGGGRYEGMIEVLEGGDYEFVGTAHRGGRVLGRDTGKFSVEGFNLEFQATRMNEDLLRQIAAKSGGAYFTASEFDQLESKLQFPMRIDQVKSEWELWNRPAVLLLCLFLLGSEWLIRKRKGML